MEKRTPSAVQGIILFLLSLLILLLTGTLSYPAHPVLGTAICELLLGLTAIAACGITGCDYETVFPFRKPGWKRFFASAGLFAAASLLVMFLSALILRLIPGAEEVGESLNETVWMGTIMQQIWTFVLLPAFGEEFLFRGFIFSAFGGEKKPLLAVLLTGVLFALSHMEPIRFLPTLLLGLTLSWIRYRSGSLLLPILFHAVQNMIAILPVLCGK